MRKYQFKVDGALVSVYPCLNGSYDREEVRLELCEGESAVLLYPERDADFGALSFNKNNIEPREPYLPFAALSCFFGRLLGFPKMTLDIKWKGKTVELPIGDEKYIFSVNVGKSKILCAKTVKFSDGIEVLARVVSGESVIAIVVCNDAELFDEGRLKLLLSSFHCEGEMSAIAASFSDKMRIRSVGTPLFYDVIKTGVAALYAEGIRLSEGECVCKLNGRDHTFSIIGGNLIFYPRIDCAPLTKMRK